ncbi:c-type cytochrome [Rhodovulum sp. YNF3179]|uniref:cytochrome c n=1 Tax=Rhodovulum sp. YNF3179 TaxID=3425127 RepID=UPI003D33EFBE
MLRTGLTAGGAALALVAACTTPVDVGRRAFDANCASCHGADGQGDGPAAAGLPVAPSDLTRIAARNGGVFPEAEVMSVIDGYTREKHYPGEMPEFGESMAGGRQVLWQAPDGALVPTPEVLVDLAGYLESIQQ